MNSHDSSGRRWPLTNFLVVLALAILLVSVATPVAGHAYLSETDPGNGEQVDDLPDKLTLTFSGDGIQVADVTITGPDGETVSDDAEIDSENTRVVYAPLESDRGADGDEDGLYTVEWEVLADDGHTTSGSFFFSVGDEPLDREQVLEAHTDDGEDDAASMSEVGANGAILLSLVVLLGAPITAWIAIYPVVGLRERRSDGKDDSQRSTTSTVDHRLKRLLAAAAVVLLGGVVALGAVRMSSFGSLSSETLGQFLEAPLGRLWLVKLAVSALLLAVLVASVVPNARGQIDRRHWLGGSVLGALVVGGTISWASHSATLVDRLQGSVVDGAHIAGAGLWVGGLLVLALVVPAVLRETPTGERAHVAGDVIRRFSIVALTGVTLAITTGLLLAAWHAPSVSALSETAYGTALSSKVVLVALALGLGGLTRFALLRRLESSSLRSASGSSPSAVREDGGRSEANSQSDSKSNGSSPKTVTTVTRAITLEAAILVGIIVLSGLLTATPTAVMAEQEESPDATLEREFDGGVLELSAVPADQYQDRLYVDEGEPVVFDVTFTSDGERLHADQGVSIQAHNEIADTQLEFDLEETDGTYSTVQALPDGQHWEFRVSGTIDGAFVSEWGDVYAMPEGHGHDHDHEYEQETDTTLLLRLGAIGIALVGSLAVTLETVRFGRLARE